MGLYIPCLIISMLLCALHPQPIRADADVLFVVQGEKGDGLDCEGDICTVGGYKKLNIDSMITATGTVRANRARFKSLNVTDLRASYDHDGDCPKGYTLDALEERFVLCQKNLGNGQYDEMVKVGDFWIDKYEISVWPQEDCSGNQIGADGGDYMPTLINAWFGEHDAYACSLVDVPPSRYLNWFQAQLSCRVSGKSLCTNAEWQTAALGTPDTASSSEVQDEGTCHIWPDTLPQDAVWTAGMDTVLTGSATMCISQQGANDMIGNVMEWVSDWRPGGSTWMLEDVVGIYVWPDGYNRDIIWNVNGAAFNGVDTYQRGLPAAVMRGGMWEHGEKAGVYALSHQYGASTSLPFSGARCCLSR